MTANADLAAEFLGDHEGPIPWQLPEGGRGAFEASNLFLGQGPNGLEVAVASSRSRPNASDVRQLWKRRKGNRPAPLLLVVVYSADGWSRTTACGPVGDDPPVYADRDPGQIERIAAAALTEPNRNAAIRLLHEMLPDADSELPGIRNVGMFATHQLKEGVPIRADWSEMAQAGLKAINERRENLVRALGFSIEQLGASTSVLRLRDNGPKTAVAVFLDENETAESGSPRFGGTSPVSHALAQADAESLPFVVMTRASQIRVYAARKHIGVGRKGRAETFIEANLALLPDTMAGYLPLLFGAEALKPDGTFEQILQESQRFASGLGERLRDRVYVDVVPQLAQVVAAHHRSSGPDTTDQELADLYELAMVILFRLLFIAYAEDKDLLPYRSNGLYQRNALKTLAGDLAERANQGPFDFDEVSTDMWDKIRSLSKAVDQGNRDWGIPAYNGGLFSSEPAVSPVGARLAELTLTNAEIGPALQALLVDLIDESVSGPVDFRSLSVREFGTIYEGLLESSLSVAPTDLTVADDGTYVPARKRDDIYVEEGEIYLHDRSGGRKATGSYFTKPFAVEHLLEHALEPALDDHLQRLRDLLDAGEEHQAAEAFFDFRCADIAMGSGHFLVAAVDHIEVRLSSFLAEHPIAGVVNELGRLRASALENLGPDLAGSYEIEQASLLRRQVARRCIYGVDLNLIAVELARLGMWIHTFVPGLPLSFLDHNLAQGNSLTGIGTLDEAVDALVPIGATRAQKGALSERVSSYLARAEDDLRRLARTADATAQEIRDARAAHQAARRATEPVRKLFDLACGVRLGVVEPFGNLAEEIISRHRSLSAAEALARDLQVLHFPIAFPEVFLRDRPGFDVIIGNPPWEKVMAETGTFWSTRFPGLRSKPIGEMNREIARLQTRRPDLSAEFDLERKRADSMRTVLLRGPYPGMGSGHPDLYKAFAWRFWHLTRHDGYMGVVLPRSAFASAGGAMWRNALLDGGSFEEVTFMVNTGHWAFDDMEPRYTIGLCSYHKGTDLAGKVRLRGPFPSLQRYRTGVAEAPAEFATSEFRTWATGAAFPLISDSRSGDVFRKLRAHPRLDVDLGGWRVRPIQGDLNATADKQHMVLDPSAKQGLWPVYAGAGFNLWTPDTGEYYAWANPDHITSHLLEKRVRQQRQSRSAFSEFPASWAKDPATLPIRRARVAFRGVARATDSRTLICALVPPMTPLVHKAPYFLWLEGDQRDEGFLLAVLSSIPLDWFARRLVETGIDYHVINAFPIPRPELGHPLRRQIIESAGRLAAVDSRFADWAEAVGVPVASVSDQEERKDLIAQLDAAVALLYGLEERDLVHIFETFHEGWDYNARLTRVLDHFGRLKDLR